MISFIWSPGNPLPAEPCFAVQPRPHNASGKTRVLYADRLSPEKGIYTLLPTLHIDIIDQNVDLTFTATTARAAPTGGPAFSRDQVHRRAIR